MTALIQREVLSSPLYKKLSSHFGSIVDFRRFPLICISSFLSKADEAIELLAFHQVVALLRTDRDHERKLVLHREFALSPGRGKSHCGVL